MFYDLNVPYSDSPELPRLVAFLYELGYTTIALTHTITERLPAIITCPIPENPFPNLPKLTVLRRCTVVLDDPSLNQRLSALASVYDIVALRPTTEKSVLAACQTLECDLISLDFSLRLPFHLKHKIVGTAIQRGLMLEICYGAGMLDANARKYVIQGAMGLIRATRGGRGIVISSEAKKAVGVRAPMDVINLASLWGLSQEKGRDAVGGLARTVVKAARTRRISYKGVVEVVDDGVTEEEKNERKRKAVEQRVASGKRAKGESGNGVQGATQGGQKLSKKQRKAQARAMKGS